MKKKIKRTIPIVVIGVFIISIFGAATASSTNEISTIQQEHKAITEPYEPGSKGKVWFGIISVQTTNVEGSLPEENYAGILMDINVTLHGTTRLSAVPIPLMFLATSFETTNTVHLQMEFFWGVVHKSTDSTSIDGFARMIIWEW